MKETKKALLPFEQIGHGFQTRKRADAARIFTDADVPQHR
jgi:hypothetical protein